MEIPQDNFQPDYKEKKQLSLSEIQTLALRLPDFVSKPIDNLSLPEIQAMCTSFFTECIKSKRLPTMTGLANALGTTRHNLLAAYNSDPDIHLTINRAKQAIVEFVETLLLSGRPPIGLIFWLKNNDNWIDKTEISHQNKTMAEILEDLEKNHQIINQSNPLSQSPTPQENIIEYDQSNIEPDADFQSEPLEGQTMADEQLVQNS